MLELASSTRPSKMMARRLEWGRDYCNAQSVLDEGKSSCSRGEACVSVLSVLQLVPTEYNTVQVSDDSRLFEFLTLSLAHGSTGRRIFVFRLREAGRRPDPSDDLTTASTHP